MQVQVGKAQSAPCCTSTFVQTDSEDDQAPRTQTTESLFEHLLHFLSDSLVWSFPE